MRDPIQPQHANVISLTFRFRTFGPLRYARITIDKSTGRSRGTGFVCFWKTEHADAAIAEAERVQAEGGAAAFGEVGATGANAIGPGATASKNPFALPSLLTVDPSSSLASKLVIQGRVLDVTRAVTREQAGVMKEDGERARQAGDKRNTYLMREGGTFLFFHRFVGEGRGKGGMNETLQDGVRGSGSLRPGLLEGGLVCDKKSRTYRCVRHGL